MEETIKIKTTNLLTGKGIKPAGFKNGWYIWEVTSEALEKMDKKGIRYESI